MSRHGSLQILGSLAACFAILIGGPLFASECSQKPEASLMSKERRISRNYELARRFYDAYVNLRKLGYADGWKAEDWEKGAEVYVFDGSPGEDGFVDRERNWKLVARLEEPQDWKDSNREEYEAVLETFPDIRQVIPFKAFCSEDGCAFQSFIGGHAKDGKYYENSEISFIWTNEHGRIVRWEIFDDWVNMPHFLGRMAGVPPHEVDYQAYIRALQRMTRERADKGAGGEP